MSTFILLSRHQSNLKDTDEALSMLSDRLKRKVESACDGVEWKVGYAVLGPYDYLDVFEAPDVETAAKVAFLVRSNTDVDTDIWAATSRDSFESMISDLEATGTGKRARDQNLDMNDVAEADRGSFPASDPPSYTGTSAS